MQKRLGVPLACAAIALFAAACQSNATPEAAQVDGAAVSQQSLNDALRAIANDPGYRCTIVAESSGSQAIEGSGSNTFDTGFSADVLSLLVEQAAIAGAVGRLGLPEGTIARNLAQSQLAIGLAPASGTNCPQSGSEVLARLTPGARDVFLALQSDENVLAAHLAGVALTNAGVTAYEQHHQGATTLSCIDAIEVTTEARASALAAEINAGAKFSTLARANSLDTTSAAKGGSLGCLSPSSLQAPLGPAVAALTIGTVSAPIHFGQNWVILSVTSRPFATLSQTAAVIVDGEQTALGKLVTAILAGAHVTIDPMYGTWSRSGEKIVSPSGPAVDLLPNPSAVTPLPAST